MNFLALFEKHRKLVTQLFNPIAHNNQEREEYLSPIKMNKFIKKRWKRCTHFLSSLGNFVYVGASFGVSSSSEEMMMKRIRDERIRMKESGWKNKELSMSLLLRLDFPLTPLPSLLLWCSSKSTVVSYFRTSSTDLTWVSCISSNLCWKQTVRVEETA